MIHKMPKNCEKNIETEFYFHIKLILRTNYRQKRNERHVKMELRIAWHKSEESNNWRKKCNEVPEIDRWRRWRQWWRKHRSVNEWKLERLVPFSFSISHFWEKEYRKWKMETERNCWGNALFVLSARKIMI